LRSTFTEIDLLPGGRWLNRLLLLLTLAGLGLNALLLLQQSVGGVPLVGLGGDCPELLVSPWSEMAGLPVALPGVLVYAALFVSLFSAGRLFLAPLCGAILGAAAWFIIVQSLLLGRYCPWCLAAHGLSIVVAVVALWREHREDTTVPVRMVGCLTALGVAGGIAILQCSGFGGDPFQPIGNQQEKGAGAIDPSVGRIYSLGDGRKVEFSKDRTYDLKVMPHLGSADARFVIVALIDYRTPACRALQKLLDALLAKYPNDLCVIILPVPMESSCNPLLSTTQPQFRDSCKLSHLALAVWLQRPEFFADYHRLLLAGGGVNDARSAALELMPTPELEAALQDSWIRQIIEANVNEWAALPDDRRKLPKLMISGTGVLDRFPMDETEFILAIEHAIGL
jgi:uncharacterized membrane protein